MLLFLLLLDSFSTDARLAVVVVVSAVKIGDETRRWVRRIKDDAVMLEFRSVVVVGDRVDFGLGGHREVSRCMVVGGS